MPSVNIEGEINETKEFWRGKKLTITGGSGFLGQALTTKLKDVGASEICIPRRDSGDLRNYENCKEACRGKDIVIHLAADVGGIGYNREHPYGIAYNNLTMATNMLRAAIECGVHKFVGIGTICEYPKYTPLPFKEEDLWTGYPEETNAPYGLAKKMLLVLGQAARQEYGLNAIHLLPVNLYGPGDNFRPESSHVIPALIKKFVDAKNEMRKDVTVWGSGNATREFLYVADAAEGIYLAAEKYNDQDPVNLGSGIEISIRDLAEKIAYYANFQGEIVWDPSKPDGQPRRQLDVTRADREFGFRASTGFDEGLKKTIDWYLQFGENPPNPVV